MPFGYCGLRGLILYGLLKRLHELIRPLPCGVGEIATAGAVEQRGSCDTCTRTRKIEDNNLVICDVILRALIG